MENRNTEEIEIDLLELFQVLIAKIWLILSAGLFLALVCFAVSKFLVTPIYE